MVIARAYARLGCGWVLLGFAVVAGQLDPARWLLGVVGERVA